MHADMINRHQVPFYLELNYHSQELFLLLYILFHIIGMMQLNNFLSQLVDRMREQQKVDTSNMYGHQMKQQLLQIQLKLVQIQEVLNA